MKKQLLLMSLCLVSWCSYSQLNGTKTIGPSGSDYTTFSGAVNALITLGVNGPVTFNVQSGTYNEQIFIPEITGASATNNITFQSATGNSADVIITFGSADMSSNYVIQLSGADYIKFKNITITATSSDYARALDISYGSCYNEFSHDVINSYPVIDKNGNPFQVAVYSGKDTIYPPRGDEFNIFSDNQINHGSYGVYFEGYNILYHEKGNVFENNTIQNFAYTGLYIRYEDSTRIKSNIIESNLRAYGIFAEYCKNSLRIEKNNIYITDTALATNNTGIWLNTCAGDTFNHIFVANNFINMPLNEIVYGINISSGYFVDVYYNSVYLPTGKALYTGALMLSCPASGSYGNINIKNNILVNTAPDGYVVNIDQNAVTLGYIYSSDNNDLYGTSSFPFKWGTSGYCGNLAAWQGSSALDANSISAIPGFVSATNLHIASSASPVTCKGVYIAEVLDDIDGTIRTTNATDIGADQISTICTVEMENNLENVFALEQSMPNPCNDIATINYSLPNSGEISFTVFNTLGQNVYSLKKSVSAGKHYLTVDTRNMPGGLYYYSLEFNKERAVGKMIVR